MNISFAGKVALVTGAASGLGFATKELTERGYKALAVTCDVSDDAQVEAMVKKTVAAFGRLDAAYNNAGIQNVLAETADSPHDDYDRVMSITE